MGGCCRLGVEQPREKCAKMMNVSTGGDAKRDQNDRNENDDKFLLSFQLFSLKFPFFNSSCLPLTPFTIILSKPLLKKIERAKKTVY